VALKPEVAFETGRKTRRRDFLRSLAANRVEGRRTNTTFGIPRTATTNTTMTAKEMTTTATAAVA
jgi:hypothetical protein